jgi:Flp pilus assembly protein TadD
MRFHALGPLEIHTGDGAVDAYVNWAGLLRSMGDSVYARRDVEAGLALAPSDPHLLCLRGQLLAEDNDIPAAKAALSAAVAADSGPAEAWASRGALADQDGDLDAPVLLFDVHADVAADVEHLGVGRAA